MLPSQKWLELTKEDLPIVLETEEVQNEKQLIILIQKTPDLRKVLEEQLNTNNKVCFFNYDKDPIIQKERVISIIP